MRVSMRVPVLRQGGTDRETLDRQWQTLDDRLSAAEIALTEAWPNARDFFDPKVLQSAVNWFLITADTLQRIRKDIYRARRELADR